MALALTLQKYAPSSNPDMAFLLVTPSGVYTPGGDALNLTPNTWADPKGLGIVGPLALPAVSPGVFAENLGGYYAQVVKGTALNNAAVKFFQPGGAELAAGAYPAAILNGSLVIEVPF